LNLIINNPWGFLALLGLPAILLIHFFQRRAKVIPLSTLFLLEQTQRESMSGRRFERLTNSVPLWMQLLAVLLLTWLLIEPRYKKADSTQQVALVIDSSASMQAVQEKLLTTLKNKLPQYQGRAKRLDLYLFESDPNKAPIYAGDNIEDALLTLESWTPYAGANDPTLSLQLARSRVRRDGIVSYITDTPINNLPFNAAFRNYSDSPQTRTWTITNSEGLESEARSIEIKANGITSIQGPFPEENSQNTQKLIIRLQDSGKNDTFPLDDLLPLVRPHPKKLIIDNTATDKYLPIGNKLITSFTNTLRSTTNLPADLTFTSYDPLLPILPETNAIIAVDETTQSTRYLRGGIVAEKHPLMDGLNWQPLLIRESLEIERTTADQVLLWQGDRPLIFLRTIQAEAENSDRKLAGQTLRPGKPSAVAENLQGKPSVQLIFNFDLTLSNALKLPATVVLLHRFTDRIRDQKIAPQSLNTETGQQLSLNFDHSPNASPLSYSSFKPDGSPLENLQLPLNQITQLHAPIEPAFYTIKQGDQLLLTASSHFADTREADLRNCATAEIASNFIETNTAKAANGIKAIEKHSYQDHLWRLWALLILATLLISWAWLKKKNQPPEEYA